MPEILMPESYIRELEGRIAELEKFVQAVRLANQLIADGYTSNGHIQLRETIAHLDREK